jgi:hypothetical protein
MDVGTLRHPPVYNDDLGEGVFRTVEADGPQCRRYQALSYWGSGGAWNGSVDWVKGGANGVSLQET